MLSIYKTACLLVVRNPVFILSVAGFLIAVEVLEQYLELGAAIGNIVWVFVIFALHRALLFDETTVLQSNRAARARPVWFGRFLALLFGLLVISAIMTMGGMLLYDGATGWQSTDESRLAPLGIGLMVSIALMLSGFGALLPAMAAADPRPFGMQLRLSLRQAPRIFGGLLIGPGLYLLVLLLCLSFWVPDAFQSDAPFYTEGPGFDYAAIAFAVPLLLATLFGWTLTVTVLCTAYKRIAPEEVLAVTTEGTARADVFS